MDITDMQYKCAIKCMIVLQIINCGDMKDNILERLNMFLKVKNISVNDVATSQGITYTTLFRQVKGDNALSARSLQAILDYDPTLSAEWLMRGDGSMTKDQQSQNTINIYRQGGNGDQVNTAGQGNNVASQDAVNMLIQQNKQLLDLLSQKL